MSYVMSAAEIDVVIPVKRNKDIRKITVIYLWQDYRLLGHEVTGRQPAVRAAFRFVRYCLTALWTLNKSHMLLHAIINAYKLYTNYYRCFNNYEHICYISDQQKCTRKKTGAFLFSKIKANGIIT